ncbi:MAG: GABA-specific high-affinity permease [Bathelium mastoideum]|nr:MAG: GABA-specific high-affinity permease [Bathelium mastoideum]
MADDKAQAEERRGSTLAEGLASDEDAAVLAKLGYKQELRRNFSTIEVFGPVGMVWGWFLANFFIFVVGIAMADLGSAMPTSGGLYWWTHYFASPRTRNPLAFLVGYSNTLGLVGGLCSIDYGFALMFLSVIVIARDGNWTPSSGDVYAVFLGCVLLHGVIATIGQRVMGRLQTVFVVMNLVLIAATLIALPIGRAHTRNSRGFIFGQVENLTAWPTGWTFMLSWLSPIWTVGGFDSCVHMSEEAANATKAVPQGILMSIGSCWVIGFAIMITIAACIDPNLQNVLGSSFGQPMAQIYYDALGKKGALGLMSLLFIVQFMMGISILVAASRQSWAFSRDGALPFSTFFRPISKTFGYIPLRAIWGCVIGAAVLGLLCLINNAAAEALFSTAVSGQQLAWATPIFCRVVWGQQKFKPGPFYTGRWSVPIAWVAIVFSAYVILLCMFPVTGPNPTPQTMNYTVVISSAVWGGALLYYFVDARKWFKGPKITLNLDDLSESQERALEAEGLNIEDLNVTASQSKAEQQ